MQQNVLLQSINSGEFSPKMEARVDFDRYPNAARSLRNFLLYPQGGVTRRPGSRFVCEVADSADETRLYGFQYSQLLAYMLEFGDGYIRAMLRQACLEVDATNAAITNGTFTANISGWTDINASAAFPFIEGSAIGSSSTGTNPYAVPLPDDVVAGDLLLMMIALGDAGTATITTPAGWNALGNTSNGNVRTFALFWKTATGTEGTTVTVTAAANHKWKTVVHRISGWTGTPEASFATGLSTTLDSPSRTASWGAKKTLFISAGAICAYAPPTTPSGYTGQVDTGDDSNLLGSEPVVVSSFANVEAATENPGAYGAVAAAEAWASATIAIQPLTTSISWDSVNKRLQLPGVASSYAAAEQAIAVSSGQMANEHVLKFTVAANGGDTVGFRVGTTTGAQDILTERALGEGEHSIAFTPGVTTFYVQFRNSGPNKTWVDNIVFLNNEPFSLVSPYGPSDWEFVRTYQGRNCLFVTHPDKPTRILTRYGHRSWSLTTAFFADGPYGSINEGFDYLAKQVVKNPLFEDGIDGWTEASSGDGYVEHQDSTHIAELDPGSSGNGGQAVLRGASRVAVGAVHVIHFLILGSGPVVVKIGTSDGDGSYITDNFNAGWTSRKVTTTASTLAVEFRYLQHDKARAGIGGFLVYPEAAHLLAPDGLTGTVTVTAFGHTPFTSDDVGRLIRLTWPGKEPGYGVILACLSSSEVTVQVVRAFGDTAPTEDWNLGAWCVDNGYPHVVGKFDGRTVFANNDKQPSTLWPSQSNDPLNMRPDSYSEGAITVEDNDAIARTLDGDSIDPIHWLNGKQQLVLGTSGGQWIAGSSGAVITPADMSAKQHSVTPGADVKSVAVEEITIFADQSKRQLYEIGFKFDDNSFVANDLTILADHILKSPVQEIVYQRRPYSTVYVRRLDGRLAALSYNRQHEVLGWSQVIMGGVFGSGDAVVESIAVIPGSDDADQMYPSDERDELWMIVKRTINGVTKRYVEFAEYFFEGPLREDYDTEGAWRTAVLAAQVDAFYVDCGLTYSGVPATLISGLDHLEGQTVRILADGKDIGTKTVTAGKITLPAAASTVHVGLAFEHTYEGLKLNYGALYRNTSVNKVKVITGLGLILLDCAELTVSTVEYDETSGRRVLGGDNVVSFGRDRDDPTAAVPLYSGETVVIPESSRSMDPRIFVSGDAPLPCSILALAPMIDSDETIGARR